MKEVVVVFKKIITCLSKPSQIGMFLFEKVYKSILLVLLLIVVAMLPFLIRLTTTDSLSNSSYTLISEQLMGSNLDFDLAISNGNLSGEKAIEIVGYEAIIFLNPNNENYTIKEAINWSVPVIEYNQTGVVVKVGGKVLKTISYQAAGILDLDFHKIMNQNYLEMDKFFASLNYVFSVLKPLWVVSNWASEFLSAVIIVFMNALIYGFLTKFIKPDITFKYRFKIALDSQIVTILGFLLAYLFDILWIMWIFEFISFVYILRALRSIVKIEIRRTPEVREDK